MATYDQIVAALKNAHAAGDVASARRLAQMAQASREGAMMRDPAAGQDPRVAQPPGALPAAPTGDIPPEMRATMAALLTPEGQAARRGEQAYDPSGIPIPADVPAWSGAGRIAAGEGVMPMPGAQPPANPEGQDWLASWADDGNPETFSRGEQMREAGLRSLESLTFGVLGDEAMAGIGAAFGQGSYSDLQAHRQDQAARYQEQYPVDALAADFAPMAIPGVGVARFIAGGATRGAQMARSIGTGAAMGATYGAMEGDETEGGRAEGALRGAALGGAFGYALPAAAEALQGLPRALGRMIGVAAQRPTVEALQSVKRAAYGLVDNSGHVFDPAAMRGLLTNARAAFTRGNFVEEVDDQARATLRILESRASQPTTLSQLDGIRQNLWSRYTSAKDQPVILDAIHAIDTLIDTHAGASPLMQAARAANAAFAKSQLLENAMTRVQDQVASTGSGGNILNRMRQAVTTIINGPEKRFFSPDEIATMRSFVRGNNLEHFLRLGGKLSPSGNGLMLSLHAYGAYASNWATLPLAVGGMVSKAASDGLGRLRVSGIQDMLAGVGGARPGLNPVATALGSTAAPLLESATPALDNALTRRPRTTQGR